MRKLFKTVALTALTGVISGSAMAQLSGPGSPSSTPGYTTYGAVNPSQLAPSGAPSSTPGYTTFGMRPVAKQVGVAAPLQAAGLPAQPQANPPQN